MKSHISSFFCLYPGFRSIDSLPSERFCEEPWSYPQKQLCWLSNTFYICCGVPGLCLRNMALNMVSNFSMQAVRATLGGLPATRSL